MTRTREYNVVIERDQNGRYRATLEEQPGWEVEAGSLEELTRQVEAKLGEEDQRPDPLVLPTSKA